MENKTVIVINGAGGVGKDTLIQVVSHKFTVWNISSVDRIKEIAKSAGWNCVKDEAGRKLLADLKQVFTAYNNFPFRYLVAQYEQFKRLNGDVMFVHIREPEEILKFKQVVPCKTLLVTRSGSEEWGLDFEKNVANFEYDYTFDNSKPIQESGAVFIELVTQIINDSQVPEAPVPVTEVVQPAEIAETE